MMRREILAALAVAALVLLAGCSAILGSAEFETSVDDVETAVVDEEHEVTVSVENIGDDDGEADVWYDVGDENYTKTVELDEEESTTVTFTHAFDEAGDHDVNVSGEAATVTVVTPLAAAEDAMDDVSTMTADGEMVMDIVFEGLDPETGEETEEEIMFDHSFEATYDFEAEELYRVGESNVSSGFISMDMAFEEWYVGGALYEKEEGDMGFGDEEQFGVEEMDFDEALDIDADEFLDGLGDAQREDTGDAYVYTVSHEDEDAMATFFEAVDDDEGFFEEDDAIESLSVEVTVTKETYHVTAISMTMEIEDEEDGEDVAGDLTYDVEFADFNTVIDDISVPDDVREEVEPEAHVHVTQNDDDTVVVRSLDMENVEQLRIEVNGETVNYLEWEDMEVPVWDAEPGDEVTVIAEPDAENVFDEVTVEVYTVPEE